jgi:hypothetical protein
MQYEQQGIAGMAVPLCPLYKQRPVMDVRYPIRVKLGMARHTVGVLFNLVEEMVRGCSTTPMHWPTAC